MPRAHLVESAAKVSTRLFDLVPCRALIVPEYLFSRLVVNGDAGPAFRGISRADAASVATAQCRLLLLLLPQVMDHLLASSRSSEEQPVLEVEFAGEEGVGQGPTNEFYAEVDIQHSF